MSTVPLAHPRVGPVAQLRQTTRDSSETAPRALGFALLAAIAYAVFEHGAVGSPAEPRLQVALAGIAALAGSAWLWTGSLRIAAPRLAAAGAALLSAFAIWCAITLSWSVAPDQTWVEFNRVLTYVVVLGLAVAVGASYAGAVQLIATGFLAVALVVTFYGLGQKVLPGLRVDGLLDLDRTAQLPRLQQPFGYWNALAVFIAMAVPIALAMAGDRERRPSIRVVGVVSLELMFVVIGCTESRGGVLALVLGLAAYVALCGAPLRSLLWLGLAALASVPPLVFALADHRLTTAGVTLGDREPAGLLLAAILAVSLLALIIGARRILTAEEVTYVGPADGRRIARGLLLAAGAVVVVAVIAVTLSSRGLSGTASHAWNSFTTTRATSSRDPSRLLSVDSQNRWVWWKEAAGAFSDRPIKGWGAGAFPVVHLLYRRDSLSVMQPHSAPLQWLAETGLVGALLALTGFVLLIAGAVTAVRRRSIDGARLMMAALVAGAVMYALHALYDWDWDIPAVTLPSIVFLGLLAGAAADRDAVALPGPGRPIRALALAALTLCMCAFALSAALPSLAASKAGSALVTASGSAGGALESAQHEAAFASSLDPLLSTGRKAQAAIALRRGEPHLARAYLLAAIRRDPSDIQAWGQLGLIELLYLGDINAARQAANRVLALDPLGQRDVALAAGILQRAEVLQTPPSASATATPLPPSFRFKARNPTSPRR